MEKDNIAGCLIGVAIGDALGAPFEGRSSNFIRRMTGSGDGRIKDFYPYMGGLGNWTDDTGMTLAVCRGFIDRETGKKSVEKCIKKAFKDWIDSDECRGPGYTVYHASKEGKSDVHSWANGALMRTSPVAIYAHLKGYNVKETAVLAYRVASLTHGHPQATLPAVECTLALLSILRGERRVPSYLDDPEALLIPLNPDWKDQLREYRELRHWPANDLDPTSGLSIWKKVFEECLGLRPGHSWSNLPTFEEGVLRAVNDCLDRDTAGAIAGGFLGAKWGIQRIPKKWKSRVEKSEEITRLAHRLIMAAQG
jgi:ADP-ribosylglycohydrolase